MKKIRNYMLSATLLLALLGFSATKTLACEQHFPDGTIGNCPDQSCEDFIDPGDGTYCVECPISYYNRNTTYATYDQKLEEAWIKTSGKPVRIMSDKYLAFSKAMFQKYGKVKRDKVINEKIKNEYIAFFRTDDHKVSAQRFEQCCKILNLKVRSDAMNAETGNGPLNKSGELRKIYTGDSVSVTNRIK